MEILSTSANAHIENTAHIFDGSLRGQRAEGDDLRHPFAAILLRDVVDHVAAALGAEVDIDIGHADAFRIQEALKQQTVLKRIDVGDLHGVAHQAAGSGAAARANRNALGFGVAYEVPDDQEVAAELHLLDHRDFEFQPLHIIGESVFQTALRLEGFEARTPLLKALPSDPREVGVGGVIGRNREVRERVLHLFEL